MHSLAIIGGKPVRKKEFPAWPMYDKRDEGALLRVLRSHRWSTICHQAEEVKTFEKEFAQYLGIKYAFAVNSGTAALEIALESLGIGEGNEVIVPAYTFVTTGTSVARNRAIPCFVDIEPETYCIAPDKIEQAVNQSTKAIIPVHLAGYCANMDRIMEIARKHNLYVVEDAAQACGSQWKSKFAGTAGDIGIFSFQAGKNIASGEGGMIITNDGKLAEKIYAIINCGRQRDKSLFYHKHIGGNYRMTEFQGALLRIQLKRLKKNTEHKRKNALFLREGLAKLSYIKNLVYGDSSVTTHSYSLFIMKYIRKHLHRSIPKLVFAKALFAEGINCFYYPFPIYGNPCFKKSFHQINFRKTDCPHAERAAYEEAIFLPLNVLLGNKEDVNDIIRALEKIFRSRKELAACAFRINMQTKPT